MTSAFDFDDALNAAYNAKTAGKNLVIAKHEVLTKAGDFLFLAHSDKEFALRCQMMEKDIESAAHRKMASVSDSKFKLVRALHAEWTMRHANCKCANDMIAKDMIMPQTMSPGPSSKPTMSPGPSSKPQVSDSSKLELDAAKENQRSHMETSKLELDAAKENQRSHMETRKLELDARRIETGSKIASKGDQKDCAECGAPATVKDVRGYLELCSKHMKKKSSLQDKIAGLKVRLAAPFEVDRTEPNRSVYTVSSPSIGPNEVSGLISKYADRRADRPEMQGETQAGRWAMVVKHDDEGKPVTATLGRIGGSKIGGDAETSPLVCTGNTHHGINGKCEHSPDDAFGGRHIAVQETTAVPYSGTLMPDVANRREGSIFAPSHRVYVLPQEEHDKIEDTMNTIAKGGVSLPERGINIPPFKREEEGRGRLVETFERGRESSQSGHGINTEMGASHGVGKVSNFTIWPSTADFGHFENETGRSRGKGENVKEILENGPRDLKGSEKTNPNYGKLVAGQEGKAGSGRVLPVATMTPEYNNTDEKKGLSGALADGSSAGLGVTTRLRPVAWGNASDSPTFKFLQDTAGKAMGPVKAVGEALRKRLVDANNERKQRVGVERVQRSQTSTPTRAPSRSQVGTDVLRQLLGGE